MKPGERMAHRTKSMIKKALLELIHETNYPEVNVGSITNRADVGRSTFYRHYPSKAAVLVDIHKDIFETLFTRPITLERCHEKKPPKQWVDFFQTYKDLGINPFSLNYNLGSDLDYLITNIGRQLVLIVEQRLAPLYRDRESAIPLSVLSQSVASSFIGQIMAWFLEYQNGDPREFAGFVYRLICAMINEAVCGGDG